LTRAFSGQQSAYGGQFTADSWELIALSFKKKAFMISQEGFFVFDPPSLKLWRMR